MSISNNSQKTSEVIDISSWPQDAEYGGVYPEGARDKKVVWCPTPPPFPFLSGGFRYLFKESSSRYPEQFWAEIIAYHIGKMLNVSVPKAFASYDSTGNKCGALIKWFFDEKNGQNYIPGGDFLKAIIPDYDRKKGTQHNFQSVGALSAYFAKEVRLQDNWLMYWSKVFLFDALIGNSDRHQDNWGLIEVKQSKKRYYARFSPAFDNGTSLGHEILEQHFHKFDNVLYINNYIKKGYHHIKWKVEDKKKAGHHELLVKLCRITPNVKKWMLSTLNFYSPRRVDEILHNCTSLANIPVPLTLKRAEFIARLLNCRHNQLSELIGNLP